MSFKGEFMSATEEIVVVFVAEPVFEVDLADVDKVDR